MAEHYLPALSSYAGHDRNQDLGGLLTKIVEKDVYQSSFLDSIPLCCPLCKGKLYKKTDALNCPGCTKTYPIISGIPDLRVFGDPYLGFDEDYKRTRLILENAHRYDFPGLLEFYWDNSPETPKHLSKKFIQGVLMGESKGEALIRALNSYETLMSQELTKEDENPLPFKGRDRVGMGLFSSEAQGDGRPKNVLEIGCGTGWFLVSAVRKYPVVIGTDIALRWLIVARKRLEEAGLKIPLICCCAEYLPFPEEVFDLVVVNATLEHTRDQERVVSESHRVLRPEGEFFIATPNRYSLSVEPHVYVWGVGFLPRKWMHRYVKFRKGVEYKKIRLHSFFELKKMLKKVYSSVYFSLPDIDKASLTNFSAWRRFQVRTYRRLCSVSVGRGFLLLFGPVYHILCIKENPGHKGQPWTKR